MDVPSALEHPKTTFVNGDSKDDTGDIPQRTIFWLSSSHSFRPTEEALAAKVSFSGNGGPWKSNEGNHIAESRDGGQSDDVAGLCIYWRSGPSRML